MIADPFLSQNKPFHILFLLSFLKSKWHSLSRYYSQSARQFISPDPLDELDGLNLYSYVKNNPIKYIDPLGTYSTERHGEIIRKGLQNSGLTASEIQVVISSNNSFDLTTQLSSQSYLHSMTAPGQSQVDAMQLRQAFKQETLNKIINSRKTRQSCGDKNMWNTEELKLFGQLQHPFVDENSGSHHWQEWHALDYVTNKNEYRTKHKEADNFLPPEDLLKNAAIVDSLFKEASGY